MRTWETMNLGDEFEVEAGSAQVVARLARFRRIRWLPLCLLPSVGWRDGDSTVRYRMATLMPGAPEGDDTEACPWLPPLAMRNGELTIERGLHQEIGWERRTDSSGMTFLVFRRQALRTRSSEAAAHFGWAPCSCVDASQCWSIRASGLMQATGPDFSGAGMVATAERRLPGGNYLRVSYANGGALVMPAQRHRAAALAQLFGAARRAARRRTRSRFPALWMGRVRAGGPAIGGSLDTVTPLRPLRECCGALLQPAPSAAHPHCAATGTRHLRHCSMCGTCWPRATGRTC